MNLLIKVRLREIVAKKLIGIVEQQRETSHRLMACIGKNYGCRLIEHLLVGVEEICLRPSLE